MIIAVDGPTASGKGTIARALASHFGLPHLDTGLLYRAVGVQCTRNGGDPDREIDAARATAFDDSVLNDPYLRSEEAGGLASRVSRHPAVRAALLERQRSFAMQAGGAVLDGRDIGTVIAPQAEVKLFVTASAEVRAKRRYDEMQQRGENISLEAMLADIRARDERDSNRAAAPLLRADDAAIIDTSHMSAAKAVEAAIAITEQKRLGEG